MEQRYFAISKNLVEWYKEIEYSKKRHNIVHKKKNQAVKKQQKLVNLDWVCLSTT